MNSALRVGWLVPLNRVAFNVGTGWMHTNDRPGYEIDARADRQERDLTGAVELRTFSRTRLGVRAERRRIAFEEGETYMGVDLREELTRTDDGFRLRHAARADAADDTCGQCGPRDRIDSSTRR